MTYATAADVAALMARELTPEETLLANRRLAQVERMILRRIPDLVDRIADGDLDEADVRDVEAEAVYRVLRNPDSITSETDGAYTYVKSREAADSTLRVTADEWATLGVRTGKMFSIVPSVAR
ncbi:Gp19/Gp15/Gp42 family protein [Mycolicibacterium sp. PDY-3]|uniref:Gp19/Gp15/Gp42 family protein n=1 Tax=Mycolicibacterium sp. PDY-3 TaxID=3376069 RepID=UPI0037BAD137